jgi:peptide/nickel transport system permease protein
MWLLVAKRLGQSALTLLILMFIVFCLARLTGDPTPLIVPAEASDADRGFFRRQYGLDLPIHLQYLTYLGNVAVGDFGVSFRTREPAIGTVLGALRPTLELATLAMVLATLIGVPLGVRAAVRPRGIADRLVDLLSSVGLALPSFWLGLLLIMAFAVTVPLFPSSGYGTPSNYVLPVVTLAVFASASIVRLTRTSMREVVGHDFVRNARILGLSERRIVLKHMLANASIPIVTFLGMQFGALLGGAIVTERVFAWPGIGQLIVEAILTRDYPVVQATVLVTAFAVLAIDPRVRA